MSSETPRIHLCMTKYEAVQFLKEKGEDGQSLLQKFVMSKAPSKDDIRLMFEQVRFNLKIKRKPGQKYLKIETNQRRFIKKRASHIWPVEKLAGGEFVAL